MNRKPTHPAAVTVVDLATGTTRTYRSATAASVKMGISNTQVLKMLRQRSMYLHWYVYPKGEDAANRAAVAAMMERYRKEGPIGNTKRSGDGLVSLRIDDKTVIMVKPEKATPEYAEKWRKRYQADVRHRENHVLVKMNDAIITTKNEKNKSYT